MDDLAAVVDNLELETFPLFGMSQGAAVSIMYALRHPERVSHLTLYALVVTGWKGIKNALASRWAMMEKLVGSGWGEENLAFPSMFAQFFLLDAKPEYVRWHAETQKKSPMTEKSSGFFFQSGCLIMSNSWLPFTNDSHLPLNITESTDSPSH